MRRRRSGGRREAPGERGRRAAPDATMLTPGEIVTVRAYAGARADEEPRAVVVGGKEIPVERVEWRAVEARDGAVRRVFVLRLAGLRMRLSVDEASGVWQVDRHLSAG